MKHQFYRFLFLLLSYLPFWFMYLISDFLYLIAYQIIGYRKKVVRENLSKSFPIKSKEELLKIEKEFYYHLSDLICIALQMHHNSSGRHMSYVLRVSEVLNPYR